MKGTALLTNRRFRQSGFTLVEVLLTLAILGVVMIPLLLWATLVFKSGADTGVSDDTNAMTQLSQYLSRDISGVVGNPPDIAPDPLQAAALNGVYRTCGMPTNGVAFLQLARSGVGGSWIVYYAAPDGMKSALYRLKCTRLTEVGDVTKLVDDLVVAPVVDHLDDDQIRIKVQPRAAGVLRLSAKRNITAAQIAATGPFVSPIIDCTPNCTVSRAGSPLGSADASSLKANITFSGRLSRSELPITHYQWTFRGADGQPSVAPIVQASVTPLSSSIPVTYTCRSLQLAGNPASSYWQPGTKSCKYTATLTVWTGGNGATPDPGAPTNSVTQSIEVRNNPPRPVVAPVAVITTYSQTVQFSALGTSDVDGVVAGLTYTWEFGDGSAEHAATGISAAHAYSLSVGSRVDATLSVADDDGEVVTVIVPVQLDISSPSVIVDVSCTRNGVPEVGASCQGSPTAPWSVVFDAHRTSLPDPDPAAFITDYRWVFQSNDNTPWINAVNGKLPANPSPMTFLAGVTSIDLQVRTNQVKDGERVVAHWFSSVVVNGPPFASAAAKPSTTITPANVQWDPSAAQKFILDGSPSYEANPAGAIGSYNWEVREGTTGTGNVVYPTSAAEAAANQDKPILGCTGYETPAGLAQPWTVSTTPTTGSKPCPSFPTLSPGKYTAAITVTNHLGKVTRSPDLLLIVNRPPTIETTTVKNAPDDAQTCSDSWSAAASNLGCVYRGLARTFQANVPTDPDGDTAFTYSWNFVGDKGTTTTATGQNAAVTFLIKDEHFNAYLQVTDDKGGIQRRPFTFYVRNQNPKPDIVVSKVHGWGVSGPSTSTVATTYNVFSNLNAADPGTTVFTSGLSKDTDTSDTVTCTWTFESGFNTLDAAATRTNVPCDTPQSYTWPVGSWDTAARNVRKVTLQVTDSDGATATAVKSVKLLKRPVVAVAVSSQALIGLGTANIVLDTAGSSEPNGGTLKYWVSYGDDCTGTTNCTVSAPTMTSGKFSHQYSRPNCRTNTDSCAKWKLSIWVESSLNQEAFAGPAAPPDPSSNGLSLVAQILLRVNEKPRLIFGNNGNPSTIDSRVLSPLDINGETGRASEKVSGNSSIAAGTCSSGTSCTYSADASYSNDPDGSRNIAGQLDNTGPCTGPTQPAATPPTTTCLTYSWGTPVGSGVTGVTITGQTTPTPVISYTRATSTPNGGYVRVPLTITDATGDTSARTLFISDIPLPVVGAPCRPFNADTLGRNASVGLDGRPQWGRADVASTCGATDRITQAAHDSIGIFDGKDYLIPATVTPASGTTPASIVRSPVTSPFDQSKNSFVNERFAPGTRVTIWSASQPGGTATATVATVTDSTLTFTGTPALTAATNVTDMIVKTTCGGVSGMACLPNRTALGGSGMTAPNYLWKFIDNSAGSECTKTATGLAATVTFNPVTTCGGKATLKVTDEAGGSATSALQDFSVADAKPVANIATTSPTVTLNSTVDLIGTVKPFDIKFDGTSSYDPDGLTAPNPGGLPSVSSYRWTVTQTAPSVGAETDVSTLDKPTITFANYGTYTVKLYVKDGVNQVGTPRSVTVKVYQKPTVQIQATASSPNSCTGSPGSPTCTLVDPSPYSASFAGVYSASNFFQGATFTSYSWNFGDPTSGASNTASGITTGGLTTAVPHDFSGYGTYTVTLSVTDSHDVVGTQTAVVVVDQPPTVTITAEYQKPDLTWVQCPVGSQVGCSANRGSAGVPVRLTASATAPSGIGTYSWNFGDPASGSNTATGAVVTHTYSTFGTYTAHLVVTTSTAGGAHTDVDFKVKVNRLPNAIVTSGSTQNPTSITIDRNVPVTSLFAGASNDPDAFPSTLPDNGIQAWHWEFVGTTPGNGCDLAVDGKIPTFTLAPTTTCDGNLTLTVTDYDGWSATAAPIPVHVQPAAPIAVITTDAPNDIGSLPDGATTAPTLNLIGSASSQPGGAPLTSYVWVVEDDTLPQVAPASCVTTPAQAVCKFVDAIGTNKTVRPTLGVGTYRAYLVVTSSDGQTGVANRPFRVDAPPLARIKATVTAGNGACTTLPEPSGLTSCTVINATPTTIGPFGVSFTDNSSKNGSPSPPTGWTWAWNFGDPTTGASNVASTRNPAHTFSGYGTFAVTLTVTDEASASSTTTALITIHRPPTVNVAATYSPAATPATPAPCTGSVGVDCAVNDYNGTGTVNFAALSTAPDGSIASTAWSFGDGGTSTQTNPTHHYLAYGLYTVTVVVTDNAGATAQTSYVVKINRRPVATITVNGGGGIALDRGVDYTKTDGSTSSDPDAGPGPRADNGIQSWSWTFTSTNPACSRTYTGKNPMLRMNPPQIAQQTLVACSGTAVLTVVDHDGGTSDSDATPFVVNNVKPVAAMVATGDLSGVAPFSPTFAPTGSNDPDTVSPTLPRGDIAGYEWTVFKGAAQYRAPILQTSFAEFTALEVDPLTANGTYTVQLVVIDTQGTRSLPAVSDTITVLSAPTAQFQLSAANSPQQSNGTPIALPAPLPLVGDGFVRVGAVEMDGATSINPNTTTTFVLYSFEACVPDNTGTGCDPTAGVFHQTRNAPAGSSKVTFVIPNTGSYLVRLTVMDSAFATATSGWSRLEVRP